MTTVSDILALMGGTGGGVGIIMLYLFIRGEIVPKSRVDEKQLDLDAMKEERDEWKRAYEIERVRADAGVQAAHVVKEVVQGFRKELSQ